MASIHDHLDRMVAAHVASSPVRAAGTGATEPAAPYAGAVYAAMVGSAVGVTVGYWGSSPMTAPPNAVIGAVVGGTLGFLASRLVTK
jgi:hypothetical protein